VSPHRRKRPFLAGFEHFVVCICYDAVAGNISVMMPYCSPRWLNEYPHKLVKPLKSFMVGSMPNLLITTPDYLLRYDSDAREVFVIEAGRPEYYGISWFPGATEIFLSHSGLENDTLQEPLSYATSEVGWISRGNDNSWPSISQPHQILCLDNGMVAVTNTGRNCLTIVNSADWSIRHHRWDGVLWDRLGSTDQSGSHFNSITISNGFLYLLAHNFDKPSYTLKFEQSNLRLVEILQHKVSGLHNLWMRDDGLFIACDTFAQGLVNLVDGQTLWRSHDPTGLSRGLAATESLIFVGSSINGSRASRRQGETGIWTVDAARFSTLDYHALGHFGGVHDIRLLDEPDLCHPHGPISLSRHLIGLTPERFISRRRLAAVEVWTSFRERWEVVFGSPEGSVDAIHFPIGQLCLMLQRNHRGSRFRISGMLNVSGQGEQHCALVGRYRGPNDTNMVAAILSRDTVGHASLGLWRESGAGWIFLGGSPMPRLFGLVELSGEGDRFAIRCDGTEILVVVDVEVPPDGGVGVRGIDSNVQTIQCEVLDLC
jgi:hypothetical protein